MLARQKIVQLITVITIALSGLLFATQWVAFRLGDQPALGRAPAHVGRYGLYYPWSFFGWWYRYGSVEHHLFDVAGAMAGAAGLLACLVGAILTGWQQRQVAATTYGSARWATNKDIKRAGLYADNGVFLGHDGKRYLRHDGPKHVIAVAPTRSGKGVGLVLPTLLSWTGSAVIHDQLTLVAHHPAFDVETAKLGRRRYDAFVDLVGHRITKSASKSRSVEPLAEGQPEDSSASDKGSP